MKRINMRTARRAQGQQAHEIARIEPTQEVKPCEEIAHEPVLPTDNFDDTTWPTRSDALVALRGWFRRRRLSYLGSARVQEFGNEQLCTGRVLHEFQSSRYRNNIIQAQGLLLAPPRTGPGGSTPHPHFLGMQVGNEKEFVFETVLEVAILARHAASQVLIDTNAIPTHFDQAFLQVTRDCDRFTDSGAEFEQHIRYFARVRTPVLGCTDIVMVETEVESWMGHQSVTVRAYDMKQVQYEPTLWERFRKFVKTKRSKARDIRRKEEVRFVERARTGSWLEHGRGEGCALYPSQHHV